MTDPEGTPQETESMPQETEHDRESSTDEATATDEATVDVNQEAEKKGLTADYQIEGEKAAAADYQTRLEEFDNVESPVSVVTLPVKTPNQEKSDEV
ncbi:MAG TPA: hypothetical protein VGO16_13110 [Pseudonocardiaceae bacterium]|nr:hypothetical protein [Pseudonocardiaceae bacterium]